MLASKLRGIATIAGLLGLAMIFVACMPGRLVMRTTLHWFSHDTYDFSTVSAGGLTGALHGAALVVLAFRLWRKPVADRAWSFIVIGAVLAIVTRAIDYLVWAAYRTSLTVTGRIYEAIGLAELAIAVVVLPLALWLARRSSDAPQMRVL